MTKRKLVPEEEPRPAYVRTWGRHPTGRCEIQGCSKPHLAKGRCRMHYYRRKRKGEDGSALSLRRDQAMRSLMHSASLVEREQWRRRVRFHDLAARVGASPWTIEPTEGGAAEEVRVRGADNVLIPLSVVKGWERVGWVTDLGYDSLVSSLRRIEVTQLGLVVIAETSSALSAKERGEPGS